ncbi:MAG: TolC family protein [Myxococcota bacterium]
MEGAVEHQLNTSNRTPDQQVARVSLTVTQSLLQGFGPAVNLARVRQSHLEAVASQFELRGYTQALVAEVENAYWAYVLATQQLEIFQSSLSLAKEQRGDVLQRIDIGMVAPTEAAVAHAEVAQREQALIDARSAWDEQRLTLARLTGVGNQSSMGRMIQPSSTPEMGASADDELDDHLKVASRWRPDLNEARLRLEQGRLETVLTRNGVLPRLDVFVSLGKTGFAASFRDAFGNITGDTFDFTAGLSLNHVLGRRATSAQDVAARASREQSARAVENLEQLVELDVRLALNELERARQQIEASEATRALREQAANAERERYNVGSSTTLLVAQAQRDLLASQITEVGAVIAYRRALVGLYLAEGTLLSRRGITMAGTVP